MGTGIFFVDVVYMPDAGQESSHRIILHQLPTLLNYMVYYIRRQLVVHFTSADTISYAALNGFANGAKGRRVFELEMERLRKKL